MEKIELKELKDNPIIEFYDDGMSDLVAKTKDGKMYVMAYNTFPDETFRSLELYEVIE